MSIASKIRQFVPPPRFITMPSVGVDISDTSLKYISFKEQHGKGVELELAHWGDIDIKEGVFERGEIKDMPALIEILKQVREITGTEYVRVSLPEERAYLFETSIAAKSSFKEIRGLLEFKLEENVPLSPRDAFFDYQIVESSDDDVLRVAVAVYTQKTVNAYYEACRGAGLFPLSFEIEAQAIARAVGTLRLGQTYMIVDFGKTRTGIGIVHKGALMYTSTVDIGGSVMSAALRAALGDRPESELTQIKNTQGIESALPNPKVYEVLCDVVGDIETELHTRIDYWNNRGIERGRRVIENVVLCGGSANMAGITEHFTQALTIPTQRAGVWSNAFSLESFVPPIDCRHSYGYATAIGLALHDFVHHQYD